MSRTLRDIVSEHAGGEPVGIYSVCSAHPYVIEAAVQNALRRDDTLLVEATSNQVDQYGGYTGMKPEDFRRFVLEIAARCGLPECQLILGGDHLGPNRWRDLPGEEAMERAENLVAAYVRAGFTKIHLDCSMPCGDDEEQLGEEVAAGRAARLADVAEREAPDDAELAYVVGTEVPVPGGADEALDGVTHTSPEAARRTLERHEEAFSEAGISGAWKRVIGLVVQPGVEFDLATVVDYDPSKTEDLSRVLEGRGDLVFEAHSTDYQTREALRDLVEDHWAILKVGPALTFAFREAVFGLASMEDELIPERDRSNLREVVERSMLEEPGYWERYYPGDGDEQRLLRRYSYSDRIRYYWPDRKIQVAFDRLVSNLSGVRIPPPLLSQYLPAQFLRVRRGELDATAKPLILDHIEDVLDDYAHACDTDERRGD